MNLNQKAVLVKVSTTSESFTARDKQLEKELATSKNTENGRARVTKEILLKEDIQVLHSLMSKIHPTSYALTAPFADGGWRLLPVNLLTRLEGNLRGLREQIDTMKMNIVNNLDTLKTNAERSLGDLYDERLVPTPQEIMESFTFTVKYGPIPEKDHIVLKAADETVEAIKKDVENSQNQWLKEAMDHVWERTLKTVEYLRDRIKEYSSNIQDDTRSRKPTLRDAVLEHVQELGGLLSDLNFTDDPKLEKIRQDIEREFANLSTDDLKDEGNEPIRKDVIEKAEKILKDMEEVF